MKISFVRIVSLAILFIPVTANAGSCPSTGWWFAVPDGRISPQISIDSTTDVDAYFWGTAGHSYSFEVKLSELGNSSGLTVYFAGNTYCPSADASYWNHTEQIDPELYSSPGIGYRASMVATSSSWYFVRVGVSSGSNDVQFSLTDTTMYNPRWSTYSGFSTQWGFFNTSSSSLQGTLTLYDTAGAVVGSPATFTLPVRTFVLQTTGALGVAANKAGSAVFTFNGPPGVITADAYFINGPATVIVPSKFEARAQDH